MPPVNYITDLPPTDAAIWSFPRSMAILGSTGSIGVNTLKIIAENPDLFKVFGLAGCNNIVLLARQAALFRPAYIAVRDQTAAEELKQLLPGGYTPRILLGPDGYMELAALKEISFVVSAQAGAAGLPATLSAASSGKIIVLANKESLVMAGGLIRQICRQSSAVVLPVDSEHNALFQVLMGQNKTPRAFFLTASGGPFFNNSPAQLDKVTPEQTLRHPTWSMGPKISVDSATLMNKGLEVIEACHLFGLKPGDIGVLIHPQSIVHALIEFSDGSTLAHLARPDMRVPINFCLGYPERPPLDAPRLDLSEMDRLTFAKPDHKAFPCLSLAIETMHKGQDYAVVMNAANEEAVKRFLNKTIAFTDIPKLIETALARHQARKLENLEQIMDLDSETRRAMA